MISFFTSAPLREGDELPLDEGGVAHARARRVGEGDEARLLDGRGTAALGVISTVDKRRVTVRIRSVKRVDPPTALQVLVPVADRDRMLMAAEKCAELQVTDWQPVWFARSRSVSPRGEGTKFREKVQARMQSALEQSGGAWLPRVSDELELGPALQATSAPVRLILDSRGTSMEPHISNDPIALMIGPEGGIEEHERALAMQHGWRPVSLSVTTLRFETAVIAAVATVRALQIGRSVHGP